jgi:hypothetical protein
MSDKTCAHCWRACDDDYRCNECQGSAVCQACAKEAGIFGLSPILKELAQRKKQERIKAMERANYDSIH